MQAGISTASLFLKKPNEEAVALLREWGVPVAEVFLSTFSEYNRNFGRKVAENKGNVFVNSVHTLTEQYEPQLYGAYDRVRKDAVSVLRGVMEVAREMGAQYYTFHGVARIKRTGNYDNFSHLSPKTREICDFCRTFGVTLAFENVEWATYNRPGVFRELKRDCPDLKGVLCAFLRRRRKRRHLSGGERSVRRRGDAPLSHRQRVRRRNSFGELCKGLRAIGRAQRILSLVAGKNL